MKLPPDAVIDERKLRQYLLAPRTDDDKSAYLALAGYDATNWHRLEADIRDLLRTADAEVTRTTPYGNLYAASGRLIGPNGTTLNVITIWITLKASGETRFVTLVPDKEKQE